MIDREEIRSVMLVEEDGWETSLRVVIVVKFGSLVVLFALVKFSKNLVS